MKAMTCSSFRDEMIREWSGITTTRGSAAALGRWSAAEPALDGFAGLAEVVDAIAVPIGQSYDASLEIAQAVIRVAAEDILARHLMLQVMAPILSKECFKSSHLLRAQGVVVDDSEIVTLVPSAASGRKRKRALREAPGCRSVQGISAPRPDVLGALLEVKSPSDTYGLDWRDLAL